MVSMLQSNVVTVLTRGKAHIFTFTVQNNHIYSFVYFYIDGNEIDVFIRFHD